MSISSSFNFADCAQKISISYDMAALVCAHMHKIKHACFLTEEDEYNHILTYKINNEYEAMKSSFFSKKARSRKFHFCLDLL